MNTSNMRSGTCEQCNQFHKEVKTVKCNCEYAGKAVCFSCAMVHLLGDHPELVPEEIQKIANMLGRDEVASIARQMGNGVSADEIIKQPVADEIKARFEQTRKRAESAQYN